MEKLQRFEDYHNKNKDINDILKELEQQKKEINKQIHLFKVLEIGSIVQGLIDDGTLKNHEVSAIMFHHNYDYDYGNELICDFKDLDGHDSHKSYLPY
jgi:hypothetical protein